MSVEKGITADDLQPTKPINGQEWCAYTYILFPENVNENRGVIKVICTGPSEEYVTEKVEQMLASGDIEAIVPFVRISPTGRYKFINPGGDKRDKTDVYNTQTKEAVVKTRENLFKKQQEEMKTLMERQKMLEKEAKEEEQRAPDSYEVYANYRVKEDSIKSWLKLQEKEIAKQKLNLLECTKKRQTLDKTHPQLARRFKKEYNNNVSPEDNPE